MTSVAKTSLLLLTSVVVGCAVEPPATPGLTGAWFVRGRTQVAYRQQVPCFFEPGPCYQDSTVYQCEWSVTLSLGGRSGEYAGSYRDGWSQCSDGSQLSTAGSATAVIRGQPFRLGQGFPLYWPVSLRLEGPGTTRLLEGAVVPPDSMYGSSGLAGYAPACVGVGLCGRGSFVASQRAMPLGPLADVDHR